jgi:hypothetical protein
MAKITVRGWIVGSTTVYGYVTDNVTGYYWTGTVLEAYNVAHQSSYKVALTEIGSTGDYQGTIAGTLPAGDYTRTVRDGSSGFGTDTFVGANELNWNGTAEVYQTGDSFSRIGANGVGLTSVGLSSTGLDSVAAPVDVTTNADARSTFMKMVRALFDRFFDRVEQTATAQTVKNDSGVAFATMPISDDGATAVKDKSA